MELEKGQYRVSSVQFLVYNLFLTYSSTISQEVFFFLLSLNVTETHWTHVQFIC